MNGQKSRKMRKIAQQNTIGLAPEKTRQAYQELKTLYKAGAIK